MTGAKRVRQRERVKKERKKRGTMNCAEWRGELGTVKKEERGAEREWEGGREGGREWMCREKRKRGGESDTSPASENYDSSFSLPQWFPLPTFLGGGVVLKAPRACCCWAALLSLFSNFRRESPTPSRARMYKHSRRHTARERLLIPFPYSPAFVSSCQLYFRPFLPTAVRRHTRQRALVVAGY